MKQGMEQRSQTERDELRQYLKEVWHSVDETFQLHDQLLKSLDEKQWAAAKSEITKLEQLRTVIHAQLQGMDYELQMPTPQAKILTSYAKIIDKNVTDWHKLHCRIGATTGLTVEGDTMVSPDL